jgi:hypothetical protein
VVLTACYPAPSADDCTDADLDLRVQEQLPSATTSCQYYVGVGWLLIPTYIPRTGDQTTSLDIVLSLGFHGHRPMIPLCTRRYLLH